MVRELFGKGCSKKGWLLGDRGTWGKATLGGREMLEGREAWREKKLLGEMGRELLGRGESFFETWRDVL